MAGALTKAFRVACGPADACTRMAIAVGENRAATATPSGDADPFALRDLVYIERTLTRLSNKRPRPVVG